MGWDIDLLVDGKPAQVEPHETGSIRVAKMVDGDLVPTSTCDATCCLTYNYSRLYSLAGFNLREMNGKKASDTISDMESVVEKLGTRKDDDYWKDTPGNAGAGLAQLLSWAKQCPDGIWEIL